VASTNPAKSVLSPPQDKQSARRTQNEWAQKRAHAGEARSYYVRGFSSALLGGLCAVAGGMPPAMVRSRPDGAMPAVALMLRG